MTDDLQYTDAELRRIYRETRVIAMVGASPSWNRPSHFVLKYMQGKGYRVIPVNPAAAGEVISGEKVYATLAQIPERIDLVDVFRNSQAAGPITDEAIAAKAQVVWMQLTVRNDEAAARARAAGLRVVMNRCLKIEYGRLFGELAWAGVNTGVISARRPRGAP
ncbi:MAG TPA: CoA-binding protein [Anaeromyxobacter sp.]|nr:CoA-binding protein [Anaeromyxobacter sp.]